MILGQVICLLLISIVTSQDYTLENTQNSEKPYKATINIESQNKQVSTSSTNPQNLVNEISSEMKLERQAESSVNEPEEIKQRIPNEMQSDADQFLSSIQNSNELKKALLDELKSLKERETHRIETEQDFSQPENSMENTALQAELEVPKQKREISKRDVQSRDYKFEESELDALTELTDKLRSGVSFPISKSYMKILCKLCTKLSCRPKCKDDGHCHSQMACVNGSCIHICSERIVCGKNTDCLMVNHRPVCKCKPGFTENPNFSCKPITGSVSDQGCSSNHACHCSSNNECPGDLACIKGICIDLCLMRVQCGRDAICRMLNHEAICTCKAGYTGDPLSFCHFTAIEIPSLCPPNSCGPNTFCKVVDDKISCKCLPDYVGNPWTGCRLRCRRHTVCKDNEACVDNMCRSACKLCGKNAICEAVNNHRPICKCTTGYFGNPYKECVKKQECKSNIDCPKHKPVCKHFGCENPCGGSCGINALCIIQGDQGYCLCPEFYYGNPHIRCRAPPCLPNFKCPSNLACVNDTCLDTCRTSPKCGTNARCRIQANKAICICDPGFTGDPLISCKKIANPNRCLPNSCGPDAKCQIVSGKITCQCLPQHVGNPWIGCRPGCAQHDDCRENEACVAKTCRGACHLCGKDAMCEGVTNHRPICKCPPGYRGNPYKWCIKQRECSENIDCPKIKPICTNYECGNPCMNLCGTNALCRIIGDQGVCFCPEFYFGNPNIECRPPPCLPGDRCPMNLACVNGVCFDLCSKTKKCGKNAACQIQDNKPVCICYPGFTGDPLTICKKIESPVFCPPNSCGPNTQCEVISRKIICKCLPKHVGNPWKGCQHTCSNHYDCRETEACIGGICQDACKLCGNNSMCKELVANKPVCICRPGFTENPNRECIQIGDCVKNSDCSSFKPVCKEHKCQNPCERACGVGAICHLKVDEAICSCPNGYTGDPLVKCKLLEQLCRVSPCGPKSKCIMSATGKPICKCLPSFVGNPWQGCVKKCINHRECKKQEICIQSICQDSCKLCGQKAICRRVPWSNPICKCPEGFNGDPFKKCSQIGDCLTNSDCPPRKPICKQFECQNPCLGACGIDALCRIEGVKAVCTCPNEFTGDPLVKCRRMNCRHDHQCKCTADHDCPETLSCVNQTCVDLCLLGKKCGGNALCQMRKHKAICICRPGLTGDPLVNCVPPCHSQNDCPNNFACKNNICVDLCKKFPNCGRNATCKVVNNDAVCLCSPGFTGNPFKYCKKIEPVKICNKSPCGPNTICLLVNRKPVCKCLPNYVGNPWKGCLQSCKIHRNCKMTEICINNTCQDACLSCGIKAICQRVSWNEPICKCPVGYTGNPRKECRPIGDCITNVECPPNKPVCNQFHCQNPCIGACGIDALCSIQGVKPICTCPQEFTGDPLVKCKRMNCRHEHECKCMEDHDCPVTLSCVNGFCVDLCFLGKKCGKNAACHMRHHKAVCECQPGLIGNPLIKCEPPCYSQKDCAPNFACRDKICVDSCGTFRKCGKNALCKINNNEPTCVCPPGYKGNPLKNCRIIQPVKYCDRSPCGPNTICIIIRGKPFCRCLPNYYGNPWKGCLQRCRIHKECKMNEVCIDSICQDACTLCGKLAICERVPWHESVCKCPPGYTGNAFEGCKQIGDCITNADCPERKPVCKRYRCQNPCIGACGIDALCHIKGTEAVCTCPPEYTGDPLIKCKRINCRHEHQCKCTNDYDCPETLSCLRGVCVDLCLVGHKCGINALCQMRQHKAICVCEPGLTGDPLVKCVPPCYSQEDCSPNMACVNSRCVDLCRQKTCGRNSVCKIVNNKAVCLCIHGFTGNPSIVCSKIEPVKICPISPCGPNTTCFIIKNKTVCKCLPNFVGDPWKGCSKRCQSDSICEMHEKCIKNICQDACKLCGIKAMCQKIPMQRPICKCPPGYTGNPYQRCKLIGDCITNAQCPPLKPVCKNYRCLNPCHRACGIDALCRIQGVEAICTCPDEFMGDPLVKCKRMNCRHEHQCKCNIDHDCPKTLSCVRGICVDICLAGHKCGINAVCQMGQHKAICICEAGLTGDPLIKCVSHCGPVDNCRCSTNMDCPAELACVKGICSDLCLMGKKCGLDAVCVMHNHTAICKCKPGLTGDPLISCNTFAVNSPSRCNSSSCGPNTICETVNNKAFCKCIPPFVGDPWVGCHSECHIDTDCSLKHVCIANHCQHACNLCVEYSFCEGAVGHRAVCKCLPGYTGDPFKLCIKERECTKNSDCPHMKPFCDKFQCKNPCDNACGINALCYVKELRPRCHCPKHHIGNPYTMCTPQACTPGNCKIRCKNSTQCPKNMACSNNICINLCSRKDTCGTNAVCKMVSHKAVCQCRPGFTGNPSKKCRQFNPVQICPESPCGPNTLCLVIYKKKVCICLSNTIGNPLKGCHPECKRDHDCSNHHACIDGKCQNACKLCGIYNICTNVVQHRPICACPPNFSTECSLKPECMRNSDCPKMKPFCRNYKCENPCDGICGINALCDVGRWKPICYCPMHYTGNPLVFCKPEYRCSCKSQQECPPSLACVKGICINVCFLGKTCGKNAVCKVLDHKALCVCIPGHTGNPNRLCRPNQLIPICTHDNRCRCKAHQECPTNLACVKGICINICLLGKKCGTNAICKVVDHKAMCVCIPGHTGNPNILCRPNQLKPVCTHDNICCCKAHQECPTNLACVKGVCINICSIGKKCGTNAICKVVDHKAMCVCIPGHTGNPNRLCRPNQLIPICTHDSRCRCHAHQECPTNLACVKGICINICLIGKKCGTNAICKVVHHKAVCVCITGHIGDANGICRPSQVKPHCDPEFGCGNICVSDKDCPKHLTCKKGACIDTCSWNIKFGCAMNAMCVTKNHIPTCICKPGFTGDALVACVKIKPVVACPSTVSCGSNAFCTMQNNEAVCMCNHGYTGDPLTECQKTDELVDACSPSPCGSNTLCLIVDDKPYCKCLPKYVGNPSEGCYHSCEIDFDCKEKEACIEHECQSSCKLCGKNARCEGTKRHRPICKCPRGFMGNPYRQCKTKAECAIHVDCPKSKPLCNKTRCINPCNSACGIGAKCNLLGIKATCYCPRPLTGDPTKICVPAGISGLCRHKQCPANAKCEIQIKSNGQYIAVCKCLPGYHEHAKQCFLETCTEDHQCVEHKACINSTCGNPCRNRCGPKTSCKTINHKPICSCLPGFEGNPNVECVPQKVKPCVLLKICPKK